MLNISARPVFFQRANPPKKPAIPPLDISFENREPCSIDIFNDHCNYGGMGL